MDSMFFCMRTLLFQYFFVWTFVFVLSFFERENLMGSEVSRIWEEIGERKGYGQNICKIF